MHAVQVLCAHRRGPHGVAMWRSQIEAWLTEAIAGYAAHGWYAGRPLLVTQNDYALDLFNGDTGVVIDDGTAGCAARSSVGARSSTCRRAVCPRSRRSTP